jgi:hypothetical protein
VGGRLRYDLINYYPRVIAATATLVREGYFRASDALPQATPRTRRHLGHPSRGKAFSRSARSANRALDGD